MKILFIAPFPPPLGGNSLAVKVFFDGLVKIHHIDVIDTNKDSFKSGVNSFKRIIQVLLIIRKVWHKKNDADSIYLSISESFAGNIRDLFIYVICFKRLKKMIIHLLGGAGMKKMMEKRGGHYKINRFFISRLGGIVVEGLTQAGIFSNAISREKIHIVPNFAEEFLFVSEKEIKDRFANICPLKILFLSNLIFGKGYNELVDAYLGLKDELKEKIKIVFVGGFESDKHKNEFIKKIDGHKGLIYHGLFVYGNEKKTLYSNSHIFCLPTYFPYEGQPISILEAYATGCVVITTNHSGIRDIFCDGVNGYEVQKRSAKSIKLILEQIIEKKERLLPMAISNREIAYEKYRTSIYVASLKRIVEGIGSRSND
jgi:glycosyltransferase involved in cell wall biosynthesis